MPDQAVEADPSQMRINRELVNRQMDLLQRPLMYRLSCRPFNPFPRSDLFHSRHSSCIARSAHCSGTEESLMWHAVMHSVWVMLPLEPCNDWACYQFAKQQPNLGYWSGLYNYRLASRHVFPWSCMLAYLCANVSVILL